MLPELDVDGEKYNLPFPNFGRPSIIGYIGLENLKFAKETHNRKVNFDLNVLIDKAVHKPDDLDVKLTDLLRFLSEQEIRLNLSGHNNLHKANFFCYRGLMTCVACTPYENREPWKIVALLFNGNIYLCARETEEKITRRCNMSAEEKKFQSWGYKFEQYMLSDTPDTEPNPNVPVDETEEFSLVFKTHLNRHNIVYGAEMDGIHCEPGRVSPPPNQELGAEAILNYLSSKKFIELKTTKRVEHPRQEASFRRFKTKKWWCQSFLAGVDKLVCGIRDDAGIVNELKSYHMRDLSRMSQKFWNPNVCFNFLDAFFTFVKQCLAQEIIKNHGETALHDLQSLPLISIMLEWNPGMPVKFTGRHSNEDDPILPEWFLQQFSKKGSRE